MNASGNAPVQSNPGGVTRTLTRAPVLIVLTILAIAAVAFNGVVQALDVHFKKERVELRKPLTALPSVLGTWKQLTRDEPLPAEQEHALGTKDYISRWYVDTSRVPAERLAGLDSLSNDARGRLLGELIGRHPGAVINIHMAYYTGQADTVAHVPERCMVGGGFDPDPAKTRVIDLPLTPAVGPMESLRVKYIEFQQRERADFPKRNVGYAFQVNGDYEHDSTGVRAKLQNIFERYGYYCKIEMMTIMNDDTEGAQETMARFMSAALPEINRCLPDWEQFKKRDGAATTRASD